MSCTMLHYGLLSEQLVPSESHDAFWLLTFDPFKMYLSTTFLAEVEKSVVLVLPSEWRTKKMMDL